ncbi:hypothetical protein ACET3Z_004030 [Daucus carota]
MNPLNNSSKNCLANKAKPNSTIGVVKKEHFPAAVEEMSSDEQHSEVKSALSREKALLTPVAGPSNAEKPVIIVRAVAAMEELLKMVQAGEPLWIPPIRERGIEWLNKYEYLRTFSDKIEMKPMGMKSEASKQSAVVYMNPTKLVEIMMDVKQWSNMFSGIVSRASTVDVLSTGVAGTYDGALQVMTAEFQLPSPLVSAREFYFSRYCRQIDNVTWAVADVSLDNSGSASSKCRKRPSGCLIQALPNGFSTVTWVEHVEADDKAVHYIYKPVVNSGLAFGATRWLTTLHRQCGRFFCAMANNITTYEGKKSLLKLAERMVLTYCTTAGVSTAHMWTTYCESAHGTARIMTKNNLSDPGTPPGIVISGATSFWIPVPPKRVFDFLRDPQLRSKWDIMSNGGLVEEKLHIATGHGPANAVSLLQVYDTKCHGNVHILQESCADPTVSYVIYAPVNIDSVNVVFCGGDPGNVRILPCGFAILPDGPRPNAGGIVGVGSGGSLLTVAFQMLNDVIPTKGLEPGAMPPVNSLIKCVIENIISALLPNQNV